MKKLPEVRKNDFDTPEYLNYMIRTFFLRKGSLDGSLAQSNMPMLKKKDLKKNLSFDPGKNNGVLKRRIEEKLAKQFALKSGQVQLSPSAMAGTLMVIRAFAGPRDEVLIENPTYDPLFSQIQSTGARVVKFPRAWAQRFQLDFAKLEQKITRKTKLIVLTNGHNPSGVKLSDADLKTLATLARTKGIPVLFDEVYLPASPSFTAYSAGRSSWFISVGSLSKCLRLGSLRLGWILANKNLVAALDKQHLLSPCLSSASLQILEAMLTSLKKIARQGQKINRDNLEVARAWVASRDDVDWVEPSCGNIMFPRFSLDTDLLAKGMAEKYRLFMIPGRFFGHPLHSRIALVSSPGKLKRNLEKISDVLDSLSGKRKSGKRGKRTKI
jgi:aspartate/methionine/tyrosine aminotransferase